MRQPQKALIKIELCHQDESKNDCVPSCVKSVIDTLSTNNKISKNKICKLMKHSVRRGTPLENCVNLNRFLSSRNVALSFNTPDKIASN